MPHTHTVCNPMVQAQGLRQQQHQAERPGPTCGKRNVDHPSRVAGLSSAAAPKHLPLNSSFRPCAFEAGGAAQAAIINDIKTRDETSLKEIFG